MRKALTYFVWIILLCALPVYSQHIHSRETRGAQNAGNNQITIAEADQGSSSSRLKFIYDWQGDEILESIARKNGFKSVDPRTIFGDKQESIETVITNSLGSDSECEYFKDGDSDFQFTTFSISKQDLNGDSSDEIIIWGELRKIKRGEYEVVQPAAYLFILDARDEVSGFYEKCGIPNIGKICFLKLRNPKFTDVITCVDDGGNRGYKTYFIVGWSDKKFKKLFEFEGKSISDKPLADSDLSLVIIEDNLVFSAPQLEDLGRASRSSLLSIKKQLQYIYEEFSVFDPSKEAQQALQEGDGALALQFFFNLRNSQSDESGRIDRVLDSVITYCEGICYIKMGKKDNAINSFNEALKRLNGSDPAEKEYRRIISNRLSKYQAKSVSPKRKVTNISKAPVSNKSNENPDTEAYNGPAFVIGGITGKFDQFNMMVLTRTPISDPKNYAYYRNIEIISYDDIDYFQDIHRSNRIANFQIWKSQPYQKLAKYTVELIRSVQRYEYYVKAYSETQNPSYLQKMKAARNECEFYLTKTHQILKDVGALNKIYYVRTRVK